MNKCSKISIGTAQFGMSYGILNKYGQVSYEEIRKIFAIANDYGVSSLDTSGDYGTSEQLVGRILAETPQNHFEIYTKNATDDIQASYENSKRNLNNIDGYFLHYFKSLIHDPSIWKEMADLRSSGKVKHIGFSLYTPDELDYLLDNEIEFDVIQMPFSILDRRFLPYFALLGNKGIQIQVRSVFLQGVLFKDVKMLPKQLQPLGGSLMLIQNYCAENKISIESLALNYVMSIPYISKVVLGVHSAEQFRRNLDALNAEMANDYENFINTIHVTNNELLIPSNWKS